MRLYTSILAIALSGLGLSAAQTRETSAPFIAHPIATNIYGGKQLVAADINKDGKQDLIALGSQMSQLVWFQNPYWDRRSLMHGSARMTSFAASDLDNDGVPEIALAYGGSIAILQHLGDPRGIWLMKPINRIEASRRLLWADIDGNGQKALVDAPALDGAMFEMPDATQTSTFLNFYRTGDLRQETLTLTDGRKMRDLLISDSGNIVAGSVNRQKFFSTASGSRLLVYRENREGSWEPTVVDASLPAARALLAVDINGDGSHEIVASSGFPKRVYLYRASDVEGQAWQRMLLDESMSAAHCVATQLTDDAKIDISCVDDTAPFSVHWYENRGQ